MSAIEMFSIDTVADFKVPSLAEDLRSLWQNFARRRQHRRLMRKLSRLDPHLLRDMGLEPAAVYGDAVGTWDEVHGDRFRGFERG